MILADGQRRGNCGSILVLKNMKTSNKMAEIGEYKHKVQ